MPNGLISVGNNSFRQVLSEPEFDPAIGLVFRQVYEGSEKSCGAFLDTARSLGATARAYQVNGPIWRVEMRVGGNELQRDDVASQEQWTFSKEFVQVDMRNHPALIAAAGNSPGALNQWIATIDDHIAAGTDPSDTSSPYIDIYQLRSFGVKAFEVERFILRRRVSYGLQGLGGAVIEALPSIYTTSALIAAHNIPAHIANRLPADPAFAPTGHVWAWKRRVDETDIVPGVNQVSEQNDWVFAAWPELIYTLIV